MILTFIVEELAEIYFEYLQLYSFVIQFMKDIPEYIEMKQKFVWSLLKFLNFYDLQIVSNWMKDDNWIWNFNRMMGT